MWFSLSAYILLWLTLLQFIFLVSSLTNILYCFLSFRLSLTHTFSSCLILTLFLSIFFMLPLKSFPSIALPSRNRSLIAFYSLFLLRYSAFLFAGLVLPTLFKTFSPFLYFYFFLFWWMISDPKSELFYIQHMLPDLLRVFIYNENWKLTYSSNVWWLKYFRREL